MAKFEKGSTYVLYSETKKHWYMVKQVGMKSWIATNFTNIDVAQDMYQFRSNGVDLWNELKPRADFKPHTVDKTFRKSMFNVLKYGRLTED